MTLNDAAGDPGEREFLALLEAVNQSCPLPEKPKLEVVEFGQWEMNFEAMLVNLMTCERRELSLDLSDFVELAREAGITEEGVLEPDSLKKFVAWMSSPQGDSH